MATSQITAAATSGRYMSDFGKSVSPALKLMNVLTTATDASEMPTAAGIPSSRTRPEVCRMNSLVETVSTGPAAASLLATGPTSSLGAPGRGMSAGPAGARDAACRPPLRLLTMLRLGQAIVNIYGHTAVPTSQRCLGAPCAGL